MKGERSCFCEQRLGARGQLPHCSHPTPTMWPLRLSEGERLSGMQQSEPLSAGWTGVGRASQADAQCWGVSGEQRSQGRLQATARQLSLSHRTQCTTTRTEPNGPNRVYLRLVSFPVSSRAYPGRESGCRSVVSSGLTQLLTHRVQRSSDSCSSHT